MAPLTPPAKSEILLGLSSLARMLRLTPAKRALIMICWIAMSCYDCLALNFPWKYLRTHSFDHHYPLNGITKTSNKDSILTSSRRPLAHSRVHLDRCQQLLPTEVAEVMGFVWSFLWFKVRSLLINLSSTYPSSICENSTMKTMICTSLHSLSGSFPSLHHRQGSSLRSGRQHQRHSLWSDPVCGHLPGDADYSDLEWRDDLMWCVWHHWDLTNFRDHKRVQ